ncbi:MAG TPA: hypothetical protein VGD64_07165 [Acidisarcina sp.]
MRISKLTNGISVLLFVSSTIPGLGQDTKPPQHIQLTDPTPRPEDLKQKYEAMQPKQDMSPRAVALRKEQNRQQMQRAADLLVLLAQRLRDSAGSVNSATVAASSLQRASEIEVLAKMVSERMKLQ